MGLGPVPLDVGKDWTSPPFSCKSTTNHIVVTHVNLQRPTSLLAEAAKVLDSAHVKERQQSHIWRNKREHMHTRVCCFAVVCFRTPRETKE